MGFRWFNIIGFLMLLFALVTALVVKNPTLLPEGAFRVYIQHLDRKGVVPFGVPISLASICTIVFQIVSIFIAPGSLLI